jgi:multidrug efflux pump subunit AcrA (membrane-fusion protein)
MPSFKAMVDSLDDIEDEAHKPFYKEFEIKDAKGTPKKVFALDVENVDSHPTVLNLKSAFTRQKSETATAKARVAELETQVGELPDGFTADEWNRLKADDEARKANPDEKDLRKQLDAQAAALKTQHEATITALRTKLEKENGELKTALGEEKKARRSGIVQESLSRALTNAGVTKSAFVRAAKTLLEADLEVIEEEGKIDVRARAEQGGESVEDFVKGWVQTEDGKLFVEPARGGDADGSNKGGKSPEGNPWTKAGWNMTQQGAIYAADAARADRLAKAAGHKQAISASKVNAK